MNEASLSGIIVCIPARSVPPPATSTPLAVSSSIPIRLETGAVWPAGLIASAGMITPSSVVITSAATAAIRGRIVSTALISVSVPSSLTSLTPKPPPPPYGAPPLCEGWLPPLPAYARSLHRRTSRRDPELYPPRPPLYGGLLIRRP
jgi:hypothetical protein